MSPVHRLSLLLKGGVLYDGTGAEPFEADLGIRGGTLVLPGGIIPESEAVEVLDVTGLSVSPGFIDTHGHSEFTLLADPTAEGKVSQGITTEINGNCGLSAAPLIGEAMARREGDLDEYGIRERWRSFGEYFRLLESRGLVMNFATLAGHGNIRASVMGYASGGPDEGVMGRMEGLLRESIEAGALGLSTGLIYPPGVYSGMEEIEGLARCGRAARGDGFVYATHMRSEGEGLLEAVEESLAVGRKTGARVHISHIKTAWRENWHKAERCIGMLSRARAEGLGVTCDRYPYTASATELDSVLPAWAFEGGGAEELRRLREPAVRERLKAGMSGDAEYWQAVRISVVSTEKNRWMEGKSILEVARSMGMGPLDALFRLLVEEELRVGAIFQTMNEENMEKFLALPFCMVGTDSSARSLSGPTRRGRPHPRGFGSFPRFLRRHTGSASLAGAVGRVTRLPAQTFGLRGRGLLREGFYADIVVFNPRELAGRASFEEPFLRPEGIYHVIVNGRPVLLDGEMTGERPGRVLRGGG